MIDFIYLENDPDVRIIGNIKNYELQILVDSYVKEGKLIDVYWQRGNIESIYRFVEFTDCSHKGEYDMDCRNCFGKWGMYSNNNEWYETCLVDYRGYTLIHAIKFIFRPIEFIEKTEMMV